VAKRKSWSTKKEVKNKEPKVGNDSFKTPFYYLEKIFKGEPEDDLSAFVPIFTNTFLSFYDDFIYICDLLNKYTYGFSAEKDKQIMYKLFVTFFKRRKTYIPYTKKKKNEEEMVEIGEKLRRIYNWSKREFMLNLPLFIKSDTNQLSRMTGIEEKDIKKYFKILETQGGVSEQK
jgi:hypothetical protein